jgi:hypothetical protein
MKRWLMICGAEKPDFTIIEAETEVHAFEKMWGGLMADGQAIEVLRPKTWGVGDDVYYPAAFKTVFRYTGRSVLGREPSTVSITYTAVEIND